MADTLPSFPVPALQCQVYCGQNADLSEFGNPSVISLGRFPPLPLENGPLVSSLRISVNNLRNLIVSPVLLLVLSKFCAATWLPREGALGHFLGGYLPPGTPNWHPVLEN